MTSQEKNGGMSVRETPSDSAEHKPVLRRSRSISENVRSVLEVFDIVTLARKLATGPEETGPAVLFFLSRTLNIVFYKISVQVSNFVDSFGLKWESFQRSLLFVRRKAPGKEVQATEKVASEQSLFMWWMEPENCGRKKRTHGGGANRIHNGVESLFSSASGFSNFRGLLNLGIILLVVSNFRVALENVIKYGILADPFSWISVFLRDPYHWPSLSLTVMANAFIILVFYAEVCLERELIRETLGLCFHMIVLAATLIFPTIVILIRHPNPFFSAPALCIYSVVFLKLWSYVVVNRWCREERRGGDIATASTNKRNTKKRMSPLDLAHGAEHMSRKESSLANGDQRRSHLVTYPDNLTLSDLYYFMLAPTLCYELNFPRTVGIRKRFLFKRLAEMIFFPQVIICLIQQWIIPLLRNSLRPFTQSEWSVIVERLLKLAIPNHLIWLIFFYVWFHSALNVVGEILRFGDRLFYKDWWNSESVTEFWSSWNIPVHRWARRHVYKPLVISGMNRLYAQVVVFLISAFFHELLVSVPLRMFRMWAFIGMISQVPFAMFVAKCLKGGQLRNMAVWISLIIGQPLAILMYFHDYYVQFTN